MTTTELAELINRKCLYRCPNRLTPLCTVLDFRMCFGRTEVLLKPVVGVGEAWVNADNVKFMNLKEDKNNE
mgnify:CR=1 FL=1